MNEVLQHIVITLTDPDEAAGMGTLEAYFIALFPMTIVGVSVAPLEDDTGATLDIDDDGANVISGVDASDANVPGTWASVEAGGTETPVFIEQDSKVSFDINNGAVANLFTVHVWYLIGQRL